MSMYRQDFFMGSNVASGVYHVRNRKGYNYISFLNNTSATIDAYQDITTEKGKGAWIFTCPPRGQYTVPIANNRPDFTFFFNHNTGKDETFSVIWSTENLGFNTNYGLDVSTLNAIIKEDHVGLAKSSQLPASLTPTGNLAVEVKNDETNPIPVSVENLTLGGSVEISSLPPLPAGSNKIGSVDVASLPPVNVSGTVRVNDAPQATGIKTGSVSVSTTPTQLPDQVVIDGVVVLQAAKANSDIILIGNATGQHFELDAGQLFTFPADNLNKIYAVAASGTQVLKWMVGV